MTDLPYTIGFRLGPINVALGYAVALPRTLTGRFLLLAITAVLIGVQIACGLAVRWP